VKVAIFFFALCLPAFADFASGKLAYDKGDYATALSEFLPLAKQGSAVAQNMLGLMYEKGQGVPRDYQEAVRWYRMAAEQGNAIAQGLLGIMYDGEIPYMPDSKGRRGVPQDYQEALRWYRLAAEQGNEVAQDMLGFMYEKGKGLPPDYIQAHLWFNLAGDIEQRNIVASKMTPEQIAEAQRRAREWKPKTRQ